MSVPTAELTAPTAPPHRGARAVSLTGRLGAGRLYLFAAVFALTVGAVSLLLPSTPSYDPWAWLVWGREIVHVNLQTTGGPSWKPLPIIFTTAFAPFGRAAPDLWLVVARAGAVMSVLMVFKVAGRVTAGLVTRADAREDLFGRLGALAPAILAGAIAAASLTLSGGYLSDSALGYSEGLLTAAVLIAVDRHLDGKPRQAFAVGFFAALDRPEIWLFWGPYGLWLWRKDPGARRLVIGLFALIPILWFLPEYWGSGHFFRGVSRAHNPRSNSPAFAKCPFCSELVDHAWPFVLLRLKVAALLAVGAAGGLLWRSWRARGRWRLETPREHAQAALILAGVTGLGWWVVISVLTQAGFSGNNRYLVLGAALIDIAGAAGWGWAVYELASVVWRRWGARGGKVSSSSSSSPGEVPISSPSLPSSPSSASSTYSPSSAVEARATRASTARGFLWGAVALGTAAFLFLPNWVGTNYVNIPRTHRALVYQAHLREDVTKVVRELGGRSRILACGSVMTEGFQVPMVAWALGVHTLDVHASPLGPPLPPAPNVIFQTRETRGATLLPHVGDWQGKPGVHYTLAAHVRTFSVYASCKGNLTL